MSRRRFLRYAGFGAGALALPSWALPKLSKRGGLKINLAATRTSFPLLPGPETLVDRFIGEVTEGDPAALEQIPGSFLGPTIRLRTGQSFGCHLTNNLVDRTIVHWHGMNVPELADGHPRNALQPGSSYYYNYSVLNRAGTYWYHPHPDMLTGPQVYAGLAGALLVTDTEEESLALPSGEYDIPLIIQDRKIDSQNQFIYGQNPFMGTIGNRVFVNGKLDYVLSVATRIYRLRLINGSNARIYKLAWSDRTPMCVIGTDGGLIDKPSQKPCVVLAPGERVELWVDFSHYPVGTQLTLRSLRIDGLQVGFGGGTAPRNGDPIDVMRISVDRQENESLALPSQLTPITRYKLEDAVNAYSPRAFAITFDGMFLLNGAPFDMNYVAPNENVTNDTLECWEFANESGTILTGHPMHLHGQQFQVIKRSVLPQFRAARDTVRAGYTDEGWKDTILLMPGERVRFLVRFGPYPGTYLYHCHNLDHEDMGMMRNFRINP